VFGEGIIKGLAETARNFFGSYVSAERLTTVEYPEQKIASNQSARVFPFLVYEGSDALAGLRCVSCQICEKECPPKCIYIEKSKDRKPDAVGKLQFYPARFAIDISVCMSCQICTEVCPFDAIKMNVEYEISTQDRFAPLVIEREQLARPNEYFHSIHPDQAAEVDGRLGADREKARAAAEAAAAKAAAAAAAKAAAEKAAAEAAAAAPEASSKATGEGA